jgi:hypothetical protein
MIDVQPFRDPDIHEIIVQPKQAASMLPVEQLLQDVVPTGPVWTVRDMSGRIICIAGLIVHGASYATAWALLSEAKGVALLHLSRAIRRVLLGSHWTRIDMAIESGFAASVQWAKLLGFAFEGCLSAAGMADVDVYVLKRDD